MPLLNRPGSRSGQPDSETNHDALIDAIRRAVEREAPGSRTVSHPASPVAEPSAGTKRGWLESCANPDCRTGWMQLWRSRTAPIFESGWSCSPGCTEARVREAVRRESRGRTESLRPHRHRIPLGLLMLEKGWITAEQLKSALASQRQHNAGKLGSWLIRQEGVSEELVTRAVALQWSCPVLPVGAHHSAALTPLMPRLFVDAFGALPLRRSVGRLLYLGFENRIDPALALAVERMTGFKVECGVVADSEFSQAHERALRAKYPSVELVEAMSPEAVVRVLTRAIEKTKTVDAKLVRVHDLLWLRLFRKAEDGAVPEIDSVEDLLCTIAGQ
jgi:hypothetical protein